MRALSALELLAVWEQGLAQQPAQRALTLLAAACPETPPDMLAQLSVGQRDARLLTLREWTFGPQLVGLAACPECRERLELTFNVADIRVATPAKPSPLQGEGKEEVSLHQGEGTDGVKTLSLSVADCKVRFRLPNSVDVAAVADLEDAIISRRILLERCLLDARQDGHETDLAQLPANVVDAIVERMAQADPQADVQLALACPVCTHQWQAAFDIESYFWSEIDAWAYRVLREVHILASTYGWCEADILAMSPWRRQCYLGLVTGS